MFYIYIYLFIYFTKIIVYILEARLLPTRK